jgi:hypothetical protein
VNVERFDEVEFLRVLAAPFAEGTRLRDAVEVVINGERLSEVLGGVPLDVHEVRTELASRWLWGGRDVPVGRCACGDVGCIRAEAGVVRRGSAVEWDLPSVRRRFVFDGEELERSLRLVLTDD